jgi:hypothetical protein
MRVDVGGQSVLVTDDEVDVAGERKIALTSDCKKVEIVQVSTGVKVFLDGVEVR